MRLFPPRKVNEHYWKFLNSVSPDDKTLIALGLVARPRGLSGEVLVRAYNAFNPNLRADLPVVITTRNGNINTMVESARWYGKRFGVKFLNIDSRNQAESINGGEIFTEMKNLSEAKSGEFFVFELIGLSVVDSDNEIFGKIIDVMTLPANDVLVIEREDAKVLVPFIEGVVDEVDTLSKRVKISRVEEFIV